MAQKQTVFVGLSGGVDSAVSVALLKERGYDVVGVFIKIWQPEFIECTWREDRLDAMRVAAHLQIPFREVDLSDEYKKEVVEQMVRDYTNGITPNPDVLCNEKIKFGHFTRWAFENSADLIATGHYARSSRTEVTLDKPNKSDLFDDAGQTCIIKEPDGGRSDLHHGLHQLWHLLRGVDTAKDQSYFLYRIGRQELARTLFPVGEMTKHEVREKARQLCLPVADKHDSQGLCFVGDVTMQDFLSRYITVEKGAVLDTSGTRIGEHEGAAFYTIGQRHGFTTIGECASEGPYYVVAINVRDNTITVSNDRTTAACTEVTLRDVHWINEMPAANHVLLAQTRYREKPVGITVAGKNNSEIVCTFDEPHVVSPGQSLVVYNGDEVQGGGVIK